MALNLNMRAAKKSNTHLSVRAEFPRTYIPKSLASLDVIFNIDMYHLSNPAVARKMIFGKESTVLGMFVSSLFNKKD